MIIAITFTHSLRAFNEIILNLFTLKRFKKDFEYPGIQSKTRLTTPNHTYCQNIVVQKGVSICTRLKAIYIKDVKTHERSIQRNT
jgi:hypothetical protein